MAFLRTYDALSLSTLTEEQHSRTCGYWYVVTNASTPHTAFRTRAALMAWLSLTGLQLTAELPDEGAHSNQNLAGAYRAALTMDRAEFWTRDGVAFRSLDNGQYTLGLATADNDGLRTLWTLNVNVERPLFDYRESCSAIDAGDYAAPLTLTKPTYVAPRPGRTWPRVTAAPFDFVFGPAAGSRRVTVPAGVLLKPIEGEPGSYWVDQFDRCDSITKHDAVHYGIRVPEAATIERGEVPQAARFDPVTRTIRSAPGNHWLASADSWDGAIAHDATARLFARAPAVERAGRALLDAFGGNVPDWIADEAAELERALTTDR